MEMVRVDVAADAPGVTGVGTKAQVAPAGRPSASQVRAVALLKPFTAVTVTVDVLDEPAGTEAGVVAAMVKSGAGLTVKSTVVLWTNDENVPVTVTVEVPGGVATVVLIVSVESTGAPEGVTGVGVKAQLAPAGRLIAAQDRSTGLVNPFTGVTVTM